jgi:hypothetical protein
VTAPAAGASSVYVIVLPGGYAEHAVPEAEPVADWLGQMGVPASVFRYPLHTRFPVPLEALRAEISRQPGTAPVDLAGRAGHARLTTVLQLAHR